MNSFATATFSPQITEAASRAGSPLPAETLSQPRRLRNPVQQAEKQIPGGGLAPIPLEQGMIVRYGARLEMRIE
jgi:hypothetical protein